VGVNKCVDASERDKLVLREREGDRERDGEIDKENGSKEKENRNDKSKT
jgi:hypothetical protein